HRLPVAPGLGELFWADTPDLRHVTAMLRISDIARAGQLIAFLAVLASALSVALARDGRIAAAQPPNASRCQHDVDRPQHVLHPMTVVLDAAGVHQEDRLGLAPPLGPLPDAA